MDDTIKLRKDENGNTVVVTVDTSETVTPLSGDELRRQIAQHSGVINDLQKRLEVVDAFEKADKNEDVAAIPATVSNPIVSQEVLNTVTYIEPVAIPVEEVKEEVVAPVQDVPVEAAPESPVIQ